MPVAPTLGPSQATSLYVGCANGETVPRITRRSVSVLFRAIFWFAMIFSFWPPLASAQSENGAAKETKAKQDAALKKATGAYKGVFYANDFSYIEDPYYNDQLLGDQLKRWTLPDSGKLDFGGQIRTRYHHEEGMKGAQRFLDTTDDFSLLRLRLFANYRAKDWLRLFAEGIYADSANESYPARGIDDSRGDVLNLFADFNVTDRLTVRMGRQELLYGAQRLVSPLDWANSRRRFDGARVLYAGDKWAIDGFYTQFVPVESGKFDDADSDRPFYGAYAQYSGFENTTVDLYYLGAENDRTGQSLNTLGSRYFESIDDWLFEAEGALQFGDRTRDVEQNGEGFVTVGVGKKLTGWAWSPTIWAYYDFASKNYNQLYPLAHKYLGFIDAVQRTNIESPNILVTAKPHDRVTFLAWYYYFQSHSAEPVPSIGGTPTQNGSKSLGNELDLLAKIRIRPRSEASIGWSHFWRGNKIDNPKDADFVYAQLQVNF